MKIRRPQATLQIPSSFDQGKSFSTHEINCCLGPAKISIILSKLLLSMWSFVLFIFLLKKIISFFQCVENTEWAMSNVTPGSRQRISPSDHCALGRRDPPRNSGSFSSLLYGKSLMPSVLKDCAAAPLSMLSSSSDSWLVADHSSKSNAMIQDWTRYYGLCGLFLGHRRRLLSLMGSWMLVLAMPADHKNALGCLVNQ